MEKNTDSVIVKIVSVATLLAALALILIIFLRGDLMSGVVTDINSTKEGFETASIYDVYYYTGWNVIYGVIYSVALFTTVLAPVALMLRFNGAALLAGCAAISDIVLSIIVLLVKILGTNKAVHRFMAGLYLDETGAVESFGDYLGILPLICGSLLLIGSVVVLIILHRSKLHKIKLYNNDGPRELVRMIIPVLYGSIVLETVRPTITTALCEKAGGMSVVVDTFVKHFFTGSKAWGFNVPYVWFAIVTALAVVVANRYFKKAKNKVVPGLLMVLGLLYIIRCIIYVMNPPRLFGYLTLDEAVCDATELAYPLYMVVVVTDILLVVMLVCLCTKKELAKRTLFVIVGIHCVISLVAAFGAYMSVAAVHGVCLTANIAALVSCFYMAYIRGRHH